MLKSQSRIRKLLGNELKRYTLFGTQNFFFSCTMHEENILAEYFASLWTLQITGPIVFQ